MLCRGATVAGAGSEPNSSTRSRFACRNYETLIFRFRFARGAPWRDVLGLFRLAAELLELGEHRARRRARRPASCSARRPRLRPRLRAVVSAAGSRVAPAIRSAPAFPWRRAAPRSRDRSASTARASPDPSAPGWRRSSGCVRGSPEMVDLVVPTRRMICAVLELGMIAHQPQDGVRAVLAARHRRVARALLAPSGCGSATLGSASFRLELGVGLGLR